jgi:hypothetical protein
MLTDDGTANRFKSSANGATNMQTASWVLRNKFTKEVVCETFDIRKVRALNTDKYEAVPILEYLYSLNRKNGATK